MLRYRAAWKQLAREIAGQARTIEDLNGLMRLMMKSALERMLNTEMDVHLGRRPLAVAVGPVGGDRDGSDRAAHGRARAVQEGAEPSQRPLEEDGRSETGELTIATPRDRDGTFEPQLIDKHQRRVPGFDEKILALYAKGMTTRDIQEIVQELYGVEVSATLISEITADLDAEVTAWRTRPLEPVWPIVYFDGIVVHVRGANGRVSQHTIYVAMGVNLEGHKELLGLWLAESEGAKFWLSCLTDLKNRGLRDIFVACIDGLSGFAEAIHAAYPQTNVQLCIVHLVRAALRYVSDQDSKAVVARPEEDLSGGDGARGRAGVGGFRSSLGREVSDDQQDVACEVDRHHHAVRLSAGDPQGDLHDQRDRIGQQRDSQVHPEPEDLPQRGVGLEDHVHGDSRGVATKWTMPIRHWKEALNHFAILFEGRLPELDQQITYPARLTQNSVQAQTRPVPHLLLSSALLTVGICGVADFHAAVSFWSDVSRAARIAGRHC